MILALAGGAAEEPRPMISMPGSGGGKPALYADYEDDRPASAHKSERDADATQSNKKQEKGKEEATRDAKAKSGWLGGFLTKLSLRPPNQMILPDDKNPTIVWDEEHKCWRDRAAPAGEAGEPRAPPPPPGPASSSPPLQAGGATAPPSAPVSNIFKMQKGRHIKKSYVDVFNPGGAAAARAMPPAPAPAPAPLQAAPAYFVPAPAPAHAQSGMYDPTQLGDDENYQSGI